MDSPAIALRQLSKYYGRVLGVRGLELEVAPGEIFGFLGPNGAGKTTTIRILTGFLRPSSGTASIFGLDAVASSVAARRLIGFVPGVSAPYEQMTGNQVLDYLGDLQGAPSVLRGELRERLLLPASDLRRRVREYSKGMRQKLAIVQALQHDPPLLILDEPTEGLDPLMQNELFRLLEERHAGGRTVFMSSHVLSEVERLCERVAVIRQGQLVAVERVDLLRQRSGRVVTVRLKEGADPGDLPVQPGVASLESSNRHLRFTYQGDPSRLLALLAGSPLEDVTIDHPSLEEIFLGYYSGQAADA